MFLYRPLRIASNNAISFQRAREIEREEHRKRLMALDKIGSDISSSEDELLTGEEPRKSPAALVQEDNCLDDDQVCSYC